MEKISSYCPSPIGIMTIPGKGEFPIACHRWSCPHCGKWRRIRLAARVANGFFGHNDVITWTLTQKDTSTQNIVENFQKLRRILKYRYKYNNMRFMWVKELTPEPYKYVDRHGNTKWSKGGTRHLHILTLTVISQKLLRELWKEVTNGESYICWIKQQPIKKAGGYAFKYLTKSYATEKGYFPHERRYGFSKDDEFSISYYNELTEVRPYETPKHVKTEWTEENENSYTILLGDFWSIIGNPRTQPYYKLELQPEGDKHGKNRTLSNLKNVYKSRKMARTEVEQITA